jgi:hypothetical protein
MSVLKETSHAASNLTLPCCALWLCLQWVCLQWAFCKGSTPMVLGELQEAFGKLVTLARAVLQAA